MWSKASSDAAADALVVAASNPAMVLRVRWRIGSNADTRHLVHRAHSAPQAARHTAGIESPFPMQSLNPQGGPDSRRRRSEKTSSLRIAPALNARCIPHPLGLTLQGSSSLPLHPGGTATPGSAYPLVPVDGGGVP